MLAFCLKKCFWLNFTIFVIKFTINSKLSVLFFQNFPKFSIFFLQKYFFQKYFFKEKGWEEGTKRCTFNQ